MIQYRSVTIPPIHAIVALYEAARIARPVHDQTAIRDLCERANVIHAAFLSERLVGFLRGWTDGICDGFIADLAVHPDVAKEGVGRELLRLACAECPTVSWVLPATALTKVFRTKDLGPLGWQPLDGGWALPSEA
jgi:GNAT superfamily N-acetyltransferase